MCRFQPIAAQWPRGESTSSPTCFYIIKLSELKFLWQQEYWVVHISNMLVVNSSLLELHLGMTGMADTEMERLAEGLKLNRSLRYLDLQ